MARMILRITMIVGAAFVLVATAYAQRLFQDVPEEIIAFPDLILYNGKIITVDDYSLSNSLGRTVQAMAVREELIQALGASDQILRLAGPPTRKVDLRGRTVIPGMIQTHQHLHDSAVSRWTRENPEKIDEVMK